ncbi:hypothetical protein FAI40_00820 [Acetobacteraceae bacterium]|nr:hypothetical protein FAI40_00820 [Acetobacteraceae bacterium]
MNFVRKFSAFFFLFSGMFCSLAEAKQPSLMPPSDSEIFKKDAVTALDSHFWKKFEIFRSKELSWKREKANDFASQIGFELPSLDFSDDYPLIVFQVMPLLKEGIGQQVVLFLNHGDFQIQGNKPIRLWFDNGTSVGFSHVKWATHPVFAVLSDEKESANISRNIQTGALPILISQGKVALRLRYNETLAGTEDFLWYQKVTNPKKNTSLQKHILSKMLELDKKALKNDKKNALKHQSAQ